jgi:hypothetical protein
VTLVEFLHMLLGAGLVAFGVLAGATADRLRSFRGRERPASKLAPVAAPVAAMSMGEWELVSRRDVPKGAKVERAASVPAAPAPATKPTPARVDEGANAMAKDVTGALASAGYPKKLAADAVAACAAAERVSLEAWTRAALRRCARGAA